MVAERRVEMMRWMGSGTYSEGGAIGGKRGCGIRGKEQVMVTPRFLTPGFVSSKCNVSQELLVTTMWRRHTPGENPT